ncbi:sulfite dehydrogenase [Methylobacterium sp. M6A4_1b]
MPPDALRRPAHRRGFLRLAGATVGGVGVAAAARAAGGIEPLEVPPWSRTPGAPVASPAYGQPSPFERLGRRPRTPPPFPGAASTGTPLQHLHGIITPNGLHFERHHAGVPAIDPERHRLAIHGLVERPLVLTMDDLLRMPAVSRIHFLECSGNTPWLGAKPSWTLQESHGLLSCSEWTGVELATLLDEVGVRPGAAWILAEGADASGMTRSLPLDLARDGAILAYAQNGERLRPEQGYPLRLFVPGVEGNLSVKWLRRLKVGDQPFQTREETAKYTDLMPDGTARQFTFVMEAKSVITAPSGGERLGEPGFREIRGLAWTGRGRIARVEVSTDGGARWQPAALEGPILPRCLTRFRLPWRWEGGPAQLLSRATDETGYVQPDRAALVSVRGTQSFYHNNATFGWRVAADGGVSHAG